MRCQNCSLLHLPLSFRFSQRELQSVWRMKEILPQLLHWPDFCQTYLFLGEDLPVWWHLTFMPCRSNMGGITFYNYFFLSFFGWSLSCFPCLSFSAVKFLAIIFYYLFWFRRDSTLVITFYHALRVAYHCLKEGSRIFLILITWGFHVYVFLLFVALFW